VQVRCGLVGKDGGHGQVDLAVSIGLDQQVLVPRLGRLARIQQVLAAPSSSIKWEPSASLGLSYRFE